MVDLINRFRGCLLGLAAGDAVGTAVEFQPRGSFEAVTGMVGGGPFHLKPGEWTDDTSMALCLASSLLERNGFEARDQMERYWRWYRQGYMSSDGTCFDIGNTTRTALEYFNQTGDPLSGSTDPNSAGNGSIMRLAPIVLFYFPEEDLIWEYAAKSSQTTHGAVECLEACQLLGDILYRLLSGDDKKAALSGTNAGLFTSSALREIAQGCYLMKRRSEIEGIGYVVKSLEAALWCFWVTDTFEEAILIAANLGDDADTTAAICGQVAGAFYGDQSIPPRWLETLTMGEEIGMMADQFYRMQLGKFSE